MTGECQHFSIRSHGEIVCKLCGAVWVIDWTGPAHWESPDVEVNSEGKVVAARDIEPGETIAVPGSMLPQIARQTEEAVATCTVGSCHRHRKCMYQNHPRCPL